MRVAILGTGGVGLGYAAFLEAAGHRCVFWSPTGGNLPGSLTATGVVETTWSPELSKTCAGAMAGADAVIVAANGVGHRMVIEAIAPHLRSHQVAIISAHLSFGALYLSQLLAARGVAVPIAAWATTALTARRRGADGVHVSGVRSRLDVATLPVSMAERGLAISQALFGDRFEQRSDLLAIMLSNLNPPAHMANLLCNLTRAENGEDWANYGSITPAVARLIEALDRERLALAAAFGIHVRSVHEHFFHSFGVPPGSLADMAAAVFARRPELLGPKTLDTRFVTEDVPFGLVPIEAMARITGAAVPLHTAGIELFSALYARDFRAENDILPRLELSALDAPRLHALLRGGARSAAPNGTAQSPAAGQ